MNREIGTQLGDYRILSVIGRGAYGIVFEAEHVITRRIDVVKLLHDSGPASADDEQRFLREIQVQASLHHPNIAAVHTAFRTPDGLALVMEKVPGEPLSAILKRGRPPLTEGVRYILATLSALSCAEQSGIVHRDIKPDNILITPEGQVKITDFGLAHICGCARITSSGESLGTPCYMAPEQVTGTEPIDGRTDVYSTAVVLYEIVTGRPPFEGSNGFAVMLAHRNTSAAPPVEIEPAVGWQLSRAIMTALEKDPARRFQSAAEFHKELTKAMAPAVAPPPLPPPGWRHSRRAVSVASAGMFLCGLTALAAHVAWQRGSAAVRSIETKPPATPRAAQTVLPRPPEPEPALAAPMPVPEPQPGKRVSVPRPVPQKRERMERAVRQAAVQPQPAAEGKELPEARPEVEPSGKAPALPVVEPPHESKAEVPEPERAAPQSSAVLPEIKRPNVFKRAVTKIFGKRDKHETPQNASSPGNGSLPGNGPTPGKIRPD
jgi:serine/threonine protein kinase